MFDNEVTEIMNYYLDIETTGLDPLHAKIITIQYMELERNTAKPMSPLKILKEAAAADDSDNSDPETSAPNNNSIELFQHFSGISDENASARNNILIEMQKGKMQMYNHQLIFIFKSLSKVAER